MSSPTTAPAPSNDRLDWVLLGLAAVSIAAIVTASTLLVRSVPGFRWTGPTGVIAAMLALLLIAVVANYVVVSRARGALHQRLSLMRDAARELGGGDLEVVVPEADDDIGSLGRSLNAMSTRIARLLHAQRELLSGVSHELRSPLARMVVALELLEIGRGEQDPELAELIEGMREEVSLLERHISRLLEAQRVSSKRVVLSRKPLSIDALVETVVAREHNRMSHLGWKLSVDARAGGVEVLADENALDRVISTLIENAVVHAGAPSEAQAEQGDWVPALHVETELDGGDVVVRVMDRGPGLTPEQCALAFEPFARIDSSRSTRTGGTGLGLYLAKTIAEAHGGLARAYPRDGGGLVVELRLRGRDIKEQKETLRVAAVNATLAGAPPAVVPPPEQAAKALPAKALPAKALPAKALPAKALPAKALPAKAQPATAADDAARVRSTAQSGGSEAS